MNKIYDPKAIPIGEICEHADRQVFYVDVGNMETNVAQAYLESLFFEFKNREITSVVKSNQS